MSINHYENFPVASLLCPAALRPAIRAIYHFARTADDLADEGDVPTGQRSQDLAAYREDFKRLCVGELPRPRWAHVFVPLQQMVAAHALPLALLENLLSAFEQDVAQPRYLDREMLRDYCSRSANPIGRLLLHLYGVHSPALNSRSDDICTALQLINFWQDLSIDIPRGRIYLPEVDCLRHGVVASELTRGVNPAATRALVADLVHWARALMLRGAPLVHQLPGRVGWELRMVVHGGLRILDKIEKNKFAAGLHRPTLTAWDSPLLLWRTLTMSVSELRTDSQEASS